MLTREAGEILETAVCNAGNCDMHWLAAFEGKNCATFK